MHYYLLIRFLPFSKTKLQQGVFVFAATKKEKQVGARGTEEVTNSEEIRNDCQRTKVFFKSFDILTLVFNGSLQLIVSSDWVSLIFNQLSDWVSLISNHSLIGLV